MSDVREERFAICDAILGKVSPTSPWVNLDVHLLRVGCLE